MASGIVEIGNVKIDTASRRFFFSGYSVSEIHQLNENLKSFFQLLFRLTSIENNVLKKV